MLSRLLEHAPICRTFCTFLNFLFMKSLRRRPPLKNQFRVCFGWIRCCCGFLLIQSLCVPSVLWHCWLGGKKGIWPVKNWVVAWLSVWSEVQTCIWPSWFHCHSLSLASVKSRLVLPFWYRLTRVVLDRELLNGCMSVVACMKWNLEVTQALLYQWNVTTFKQVRKWLSSSCCAKVRKESDTL